MKFAFKKGTSLLDKAIKFWDHGPYSHVECILAEANGLYTIASSYPGVGVRTLQNQSLPTQEWDIVDVPTIDVTGVKTWFEEHAGQKYWYFGLFGFIIEPLVSLDKNKWFCSEACLATLKFQEPWRFSPNGMYDIVSALAAQ